MLADLTADDNKMILVLGAHRSGTSLCAAAIEALGAELGLHDHYANEENRKGFFEHPDIVSFNDRLLAELGGSWDNPLFDGARAIAAADLSPWQSEAQALLQRLFAGVTVAAIKDPRLCQLLDFWLPVLRQCGYRDDRVFLIHTLRDPVEVAVSQQLRAAGHSAFYELGRELAEGAALWLSLTAQAIATPASWQSYFVGYQQLLADPELALQGLAAFLQLPLDDARVATFCADFVDSSLHRSHAAPEARAQLEVEFPQLLEFAAVVADLSRDKPANARAMNRAADIFNRADTREALSFATAPALSRLSSSCRSDRLEVERSVEVIADLDRRRHELEVTGERVRQEHAQVLAPLQQQLVNLETGNSALQDQLSAQQAEITRISGEQADTVAQLGRAETENARLEGECSHLVRERSELESTIAGMESSISWRLTKPLRRLRSMQLEARDSAASNWHQMRLRSIGIYHRVSIRHPRLAWTLRRVLRPIFRLFNHLFSRRSPIAPQTDQGDLLRPMIYQQVEAGADYRPLVSVIVPNYNHAAYLPLRLDSIFSQSYGNIEVILLDDASSDGSAEVLREYQQRNPGNSTLVINENNSGGVFHQWEKGLAMASGDIIWIAESDDWCTENFLETLVPFFENEGIQLAYARTVFMDGAGEQETWSINDYLHDIDPQRWNQPIVETAHKIVAEAFAIKNIIPNVSSAIFRRPQSLEILQDPSWRGMKTCGDWVLYLHLLRGGMLAYSPAACNYYRMHGDNTSVKSHSGDQFYREHEQVAITVQRYFDVDSEVFTTQRDNLVTHWRETRGDYSDAAFEACYSLQRIADSETERAPRLLMASYGFCVGGGETFPVQLANIMKSRGYNVTYLDCAREPRNEGIRRNLRPDIPVVSDFSQLERIVRDFGIDVIHSHHAWVDSTILDVLPEDSHCNTVVTLHGMYETINEYDLKVILPRLVKRSAQLIYVAEKNLTALRQHKLLDRAATVRIDNALSDDPFEPVAREALGIPEQAFVCSLVSRAMEEKGWAEAIEAVTRARELSGSDIHLVLVGDGLEHERLQQEELPGYIHLEGFQRNVRGYFALADIGLLPSKFRGESFPLVIIECLQAGRPMLATDLGEISYMLDSPNGMAGEVFKLAGDELDVPGLGAIIAALASDPRRYAAMRARVGAVAQKFDPQILANKHDAVYRAATGGRQA